MQKAKAVLHQPTIPQRERNAGVHALRIVITSSRPVKAKGPGRRAENQPTHTEEPADSDPQGEAFMGTQLRS